MFRGRGRTLELQQGLFQKNVIILKLVYSLFSLQLMQLNLINYFFWHYVAFKALKFLGMETEA